MQYNATFDFDPKWDEEGVAPVYDHLLFFSDPAGENYEKLKEFYTQYNAKNYNGAADIIRNASNLHYSDAELFNKLWAITRYLQTLTVEYHDNAGLADVIKNPFVASDTVPEDPATKNAWIEDCGEV